METLARGRYAELFSSDRKWNTQERQLIDTYMSKVYDDFVMVVAKGRKMSPYDVHKVAQGRVWTGKAALEKGLVDQLGGVTDALTKARELAKLEGVSDVEIKAYPEPRSFFDLLAEGFNFAQIQEKTLYAHIPQEFHALLKRVAFLKNLTKEHFFYVLPYQIEIK
jgi:protease-4